MDLTHSCAMDYVFLKVWTMDGHKSSDTFRTKEMQSCLRLFSWSFFKGGKNKPIYAAWSCIGGIFVILKFWI